MPFPEIQNQNEQRSDRKDYKDPFARSSRVVEGFQRKSERNRRACIRTQFSGLRFGTSQDSGNEIEEAQYFYSLPKRPRLRRLRTKITRAPCRERTGEALPRAEKFGDWKTAHHEVLNEEGESRDYLRYALVVQDFATQWIQSYPCERRASCQCESSAKKKHKQ